MAKEIKYNMDARDLLKNGVDKLANAVKVTLRRLLRAFLLSTTSGRKT